MIFFIIKEKGNLKKAYKMYKASKKIKQLDLFDENFYLKKYESLRNAKISPLNHYLYHGYKENKQPGKVFDGNYYLKKYPDVKESNMNPLVHYVLYGKKEGRTIKKDSSLNEIKKLKRNISKQNDKIKKLDKTIKSQEEIIDSNVLLLNNILVFHDLKAKGLLKDIQDLCFEILRFVDNVCKKHEIEYWLSAGNLLGLIRHGDFLPWDDDMDIGMMRDDYNRFLDIVGEELENYNLNEKLMLERFEREGVNIEGFISLKYKPSPDYGETLTGLDIFPYEYFKNDENLSILEIRKKFRREVFALFRKVRANNDIKDEAIEEFYDTMGLTHEKQAFVLYGPDSSTKNITYHRVEEIFPIKRVVFKSCEISIPNDEYGFLKSFYGDDFMKIPDVVESHETIYDLLALEDENLDKIFKEEINFIKKINDNF